MEASLLSPRRVLTTALRWCTPTLGKLVALLLLSVAALYLSDHYDWFAFNKQKGWTVLIAVAAVTVGLGLIVVWLAGAYLLDRRFQFGLLSLLLMVPVVAIPVAWLTNEMRQAKEIADAIERIDKQGGRTAYRYWLAGDGTRRGSFVEPHENTPPWLRQIFGDEFFAEIVTLAIDDRNDFSCVASLKGLQDVTVGSTVLVTDDDVDALTKLPLLRSISFFDTCITDAGLKKLEGVRTLKTVVILKSQTTAGAREAFQDTLDEAIVIVKGPLDGSHSYLPEVLDQRTAGDLEQELREVEAKLQQLNADRERRPPRSRGRKRGKPLETPA